MIIFKLGEVMKKRDISAYGLSKVTGIRPNTILDWCANEGEKVKAITVDTLNKICKALECEVGDIIKYVPDDEYDE